MLSVIYALAPWIHAVKSVSMNIISQLVEFIFLKREVKDIDYNPSHAVSFYIIYTALMLNVAYQINHADPINGQPHAFESFPYGLMLVASLCFAGLYYALFAAQQRQARFVQTATAFFGSSVLLSVVSGLASLIPAGILIMIIAQGLSLACSIRATMQSLDYSAFRAFFALIGIMIIAFIVASAIFPPVLNEAALLENSGS